MGKKYNHLSAQARRIIERMYAQNCSVSRIAEHIGVHRSTIYRELKRNASANDYRHTQDYSSHYAQRKYLRMRKRDSRLMLDKPLRLFVHKQLRSGWSPWQIEWYFKREGISGVTHETIYRYIYSHWELRCKFSPCLRRKHPARLKRGQRKKRYPDHILLRNRPLSVETRREVGHWECDLMIFKRGTRQNFITLVERKTRFTIAIKNKSKQAVSTALAIVNALKPYKLSVKSMTFDRGSEFLYYSWIESCLGASVYFCDPGSPHQKGSIENRNGVIRSVFPRGYDIDNLRQSKLDCVLKDINDRPMRCINYRSPSDMFYEEVKR